MQDGIFFTCFYQPIYNLLVFFIDILPGGSVGLSVILTTIIVKFILFPLTKKALLSQIRMQELQPQIEAVRAKHKGNREAEGRAIFEIYKQAKINPFAGIVAILIQLPIIFALFFIFKDGLPQIKTEALYSFISLPEVTEIVFLGFFNLAEKGWILAIIAGATQFVQAQLMPTMTPPQKTNDGKTSFGQDFMKSMNFQIKYVLPVIIIFVAHALSSAVALYFVISNLFGIGQELFLKKHRNAIKQT